MSGIKWLSLDLSGPDVQPDVTEEDGLKASVVAKQDYSSLYVDNKLVTVPKRELTGVFAKIPSLGKLTLAEEERWLAKHLTDMVSQAKLTRLPAFQGDKPNNGLFLT